MKKAVSGIMLTLLSLGILLISVLPHVSSAEQKGNPHYVAAYSGQSTLVSGLITTNTTWTLQGSPFIVVGDVVVEPDVFLTIEAGVFVKFTTGTNLIIDGGLIAQGNSTHTITFTSNATTPSPNDWGSIRIRSGSTAANCLNRVQIEYASTALTLAADCNITASTLKYNNKGISLEDAGNVYVGDVRAANNTGLGIGGSIIQRTEIENSEFSMNGAGIAISGSANEPNVYLKNSAVVRNDGYGVEVLYGCGKVEIDNSSVSANGWNFPGPHLSYGIRHRYGNLKIYNSTVSHNKGTGLVAVNWGEVEAQNSIFLNNTNGFETAYPLARCSISNCTIRGHRSDGYGTYVSGYGIYADRNEVLASGSSITNNARDGVYGDNHANVIVYDCNISDNENGINNGYSVVSIYDSIIRNNSQNGIQIYSGTLRLNGSVVEHNLYGVSGSGNVCASDSIIINNTVGVSVTTFEGSSTTIANNSLVNIKAEGEVTLEYCNVYNSLLGVQLKSGAINYCNIYNHTEYNVKNIAGNDINATYNWWGTTNETLIEQGIYDFYDNYTLGRILYKPYLTSPTHHDIAVIDVTPSPTTVTRGDSVSIEVTVFNEGDFTETFNVSVFYDTNVIGTQTITDLSPRSEIPLSFVWDTGGVAEGIYEISAEASVVKGEEDTANNRFVDGTVTVLVPPVASLNYTPLEPLVGDVVTFNASESYDPDGVITSWNWDFGDGNVTTISNPIINHVYTSYGVYNVTLTVTDNDGLVDSEIKSITVRQYPTASFTYYPSIPEMGLTVLFDASASTPNGGTILTYTWDFGDGNVTDTSSPTILHVYFGYGNFTVTLQIQDDDGLSDVETKIIHVHALPVVDFTYTPASPLVYEFVTFNASDSFDFDGDIVSYVWDLGDGTNATETAPIVQHSYSLAGIYTVALSVIDNDGLTTTIMKDVNVGKILASVSISTSSPSTYVGFSVNITGTLHDLYGNGLADETVVLYYTVSGVGTWTPITSDATDNLGRYSAMWIPPATGYFEIKAEWAGNTTHLGATNTTTLSSLAYEDQYVFCVESNSTITELAFNTTDWTLSFAATGPDGTTGYVKVTVAKSLAGIPSDIRVVLDGEQLEFSIASVDDSWLLSFTYDHSTHQVAVDLDVNIIPEFPTWTLMLLILIVFIAASEIYKRR